MASTGGLASRSKFSLKIENEVIKCLDTGSSVVPDASAFKSFTCCKKGGENAGDESDFVLFVVTASSNSDDKVSDERGIDMVWVDSESSSGYSKKSLMGYDSRLDSQRPVHIEATQGADGKPVLVAILSPAAPAITESKRLTVWTCSELSTSNDGDDTGKLDWKPCGWFDGAEANMTQVKRASATTSSTGDHLVVIEGLDSNGETRVYYGDTSDAKNMETKLSTFPKPRDMNAAIQQVAFVRDSAFETATSLVLGAGADNGSSVLFVQSLPDTNIYQGKIDIPEDTHCFATSEGSRSVDLYVAGAKKAWCYELNAWSSSDSPRNRHQINKVDFESPAMSISALVDTEGTKHTWILLENGDLMYTFDAIGDDEVFLEPVNILPSTKAFGCHIDPVGNIHILGVSDDGKMVHNMKDEGTGLWMQKEILVPGGSAEEHLMSVVEVHVKSLGGTAKEVIATQSLPPVLISSASAAFFRVNGKGHMMYSDKVIEVTPSAAGVVRVMQFVDSFIVPRVMINVAGLERPLEVHCGKAVQNKLMNTSGDELRSAKLPDAMGQEGASLITDPDVEQEADDVADTIKGLLETFDTFQSSDFVKKNDVSGDFRLGGGALSAENQFVTWGTAEDDAIDEEGVAIPFTGDFPILIDGTPQDDTTGPSLTPFTGVMPILVAANVAEGGATSRALPSREKLIVRKKAKRAKRTTGRVARRFSKMRVVSDEATGGKENTTKHFSFKRTGRASTARPGKANSGQCKIETEAIKSERIKIKHQDAGDIAMITKEAGNKANLQAKYAAAENLRVATEFAETACARAWADADDAVAAAAEAVALAKQAIEEEEGIAGDSGAATDETGEDKSRALRFQPRGFGDKIKKAAKQAAEAAKKAAREAEKAAKKAAKAAEAAAKEAAKAAEKAKEEAAKAAQEAAERAKEAAEKAAEAAAQAADAVGDFAEDVGGEIGDTVDDAKDTLGDITDIISDAVVDGVDVVESVTMEVVDVIEEVVEVVEELGPDGVLRLVTKVVGTVVKTAIRVIVEVAGKVYEFIADQIEKAQAALNWVWEKIKVGIVAALRWLASFFNIFEIIKTADLLEDAVVDGLDALVQSIPTDEDISRVFNNMRGAVEKLTGLDLDSTEIKDESEGPDEDPKGSYVSYHASSGSFNDAKGNPPQASTDGDGVDKELEVIAGTAVDNLNTMDSLVSKLEAGGSLQEFVTALADGFLDIVEAGAKGVLNGVSKAVDALKEWIAGGGVFYIPVISEMFKFATGKDILFGKAMFFMLAIPTTYAVKLATGKFPSKVMKRTRTASRSTAPSGTASLQLVEGVSTVKSFASTPRDGETEEDDEEEADVDEKSNELAFKIATVGCDTLALGLTVALVGNKDHPLTAVQKVLVVATEALRLRSIAVNDLGQSGPENTLASFRYCFSASVAMVQLFRLADDSDAADAVDPFLKAANSSMNIFLGIVRFSEISGISKETTRKAMTGIQFTLAGVAGIGVVTSNAAKVRKAVAGFALLKTFANLMGIGIAVVHSGPDEFGIGV